MSCDFGTIKGFRTNLIEGMWRFCQSRGLLLPREGDESPDPPHYAELDYKQFVSELLALCDRLPLPVDGQGVSERIAKCLSRCDSPHLRELPVNAVQDLVLAAYHLARQQAEAGFPTRRRINDETK